MKILGIDIGGTGIKGAVVDTKKGVFKTDRLRILTPAAGHPRGRGGRGRPRSPSTSSGTAAVGCTFPGVVMHGTIHTAANLDPAWIGLAASKHFDKAHRSAHARC